MIEQVYSAKPNLIFIYIGHSVDSKIDFDLPGSNKIVNVVLHNISGLSY